MNEVLEPQSPGPVADQDCVAGVPLIHYTGVRHPTGYAGYEKAADGRVRLQSQRPLMAGSIHYVTVSDPSNIDPPFGVEDESVIQCPHMRKTLLGTCISGDLRYTGCTYQTLSCPPVGFQEIYMLYFKHFQELPIPE